MAKKTSKLLDPSKGLMQCKTCGKEWLANVKPNSGGKFYRGSWQCPNSCGKIK